MDDTPTCAKCGSDLEWERCYSLDCNDGRIDLYELDPFWHDPDDSEECDICDGKGGWHVCPSCQREAQKEWEGAK